MPCSSARKVNVQKPKTPFFIKNVRQMRLCETTIAPDRYKILSRGLTFLTTETRISLIMLKSRNTYLTVFAEFNHLYNFSDFFEGMSLLKKQFYIN